MKCFLRIAVFVAVTVVIASCNLAHAPESRSSGAVVVSRTPHGGIQPQAIFDAAGTLHLIYFSGAPEGGDLFYVRQRAGDPSYSSPIRVNSQPGSAIAVGTVRGAHLAVGRGGRVHVAWNGSYTAQPVGPGGTPMLYARLNALGTAFEPQRNLITWAGGIDGGGTVAADTGGTVYVAWHAGGKGVDDAHRAVFVARSNDDGMTFDHERQASPDGRGACSCCGMSSTVDRSSRLHLLYRAAGGNVDRAVTLLWSDDHGESFSSMAVHEWKINACPLTTSALVVADDGVVAAWETERRIYFETLRPGQPGAQRPSMQGSAAAQRHPVVARNAKGETLLAWAVDAGWGKGGDVAWQVYSAGGTPVSAAGRAQGLPAWGSLAAVARADGRFLLWY
jgi:hypothetical protein